MMNELWQQIAIGLLVGGLGAALKCFLMLRFFMTGNKALTVLVLTGRLVIDVVALFLMHYWLAALIACAVGLVCDQVYLVLRSLRQRGE